jgi:nucleotide-binding universal stress UspA family protein
MTALARAGRSGRAPERPRYDRILLASEGRGFSDAAIAKVGDLAAPGAHVHVFSIARIHGTAFGMPTPGLLPTKAEWAEQRTFIESAIKQLKRRRLTAGGHVLGTRNAAKKIVQEARAHDCEVIVMAADPDRNRMISTAMWSQEPQRVSRRSKLPVFLVTGEDAAPGSRRAGRADARA